MPSSVPRKQILVVEDDASVAQLLEKLLQMEGWDVRIAPDYAAAEQAWTASKPNLVVLDWMLPDRNGLEVLKMIRDTTQIPVLFLTARDDVSDKVLGLEFGADDYVTKPFQQRELVARIRMLLRRTQLPESTSSLVKQGPFEIVVSERRVTRGGAPIELTRIEFDLLLYFMRNPKVVLTREVLLRDVWGYEFAGYQRTVDAHIRRLRSKVEPEPDRPRFIHSVRGVGYRFELNPE